MLVSTKQNSDISTKVRMYEVPPKLQIN
jgi:hypothetical protein